MTGTHLHLTFWMKAFQTFALAVAVCFWLGVTDASSRFDKLNHKLMCTCSCNELLGECNHVSCPMSGPELDELSVGIAGGRSDKEILALFAAKYGAIVLAAPTTHGFDLVAWIAPFAVFAAALLGTILLVRRWTGDKEQANAAAWPANEALRKQIRRETDGE